MTSDVPDSVTYREIRELLAVFGRSQWSGMELEVRGVRVVVGRTGPPAAATSSPAPAPAHDRRLDEPTDAPRPDPRRSGDHGDRGAPAAPTPATPAAAAQPAIDRTGLVDVRSPAVGAFWVAPGPGQAAFAPVGTRVEADQQVAIVEVMKLMNPVLAPVAGEVVEVCAVNADLVEYDQPLFRIRPDERAG